MRKLAIVLVTMFLWSAQAESCSSTDFIDNGDGTVTHTKTGLMWKRCSEGQIWDGVNNACTGTATTFSWQGALQQAGTMNFGGGFATFSDWRVPNVKEMNSMTDGQCGTYAPTFPSMPSGNSWYWSSSPSLSAPSRARFVGFLYGITSDAPKGDNNYVRLVRLGQ